MTLASKNSTLRIKSNRPTTGGLSVKKAIGTAGTAGAALSLSALALALIPGSASGGTQPPDGVSGSFTDRQDVISAAVRAAMNTDNGRIRGYAAIVVHPTSNDSITVTIKDADGSRQLSFKGPDFGVLSDPRFTGLSEPDSEFAIRLDDLLGLQADFSLDKAGEHVTVTVVTDDAR